MDRAEFLGEMTKLRRSRWDLAALVGELARPDTWVRRTVLGLDVFVQNVGGTLRAFHNVCSHRLFPLCREPRGAGPVRCGFHGWVYDGRGVPIGVPRNKELFQLTREEQEALALPQLRVAVRGEAVLLAAEDLPPPEDCMPRLLGVLERLPATGSTDVWRDELMLPVHWAQLRDLPPFDVFPFEGGALVERVVPRGPEETQVELLVVERAPGAEGSAGQALAAGRKAALLQAADGARQRV